MGWGSPSMQAYSRRSMISIRWAAVTMQAASYRQATGRVMSSDEGHLAGWG